MSLIVNLISGPSTGKSTLAHGLMYKLKVNGYSCEYTGEYAKDLRYEERNSTLTNQLYILSKQYQRIFRMLNTVDVIITDSPILLSLVYQQQWLQEIPSFSELVMDLYNRDNNILAFVRRTPTIKFEDKARFHNEVQSVEIDADIEITLQKNYIDYFDVYSGDEGLEILYNKSIESLGK